ncbi:hypothetical protein HanRHA438_Chr12g0566381 [Helianthus annuus]|nr:hypothetical protein HanRHA438_Chr12g0566381 [Helianthus annuus]
MRVDVDDVRLRHELTLMMARVTFSSILCSGKRQRQQSRVLLGSRLKTLWVRLTDVTQVN